MNQDFCNSPLWFVNIFYRFTDDNLVRLGMICNRALSTLSTCFVRELQQRVFFFLIATRLTIQPRICVDDVVMSLTGILIHIAFTKHQPGDADLRKPTMDSLNSISCRRSVPIEDA